MKFLIPESRKETSVLKIALISAGIVLAVAGAAMVIWKYFCRHGCGCGCGCDCDCDCDCDCGCGCKEEECSCEEENGCECDCGCECGESVIDDVKDKASEAFETVKEKVEDVSDKLFGNNDAE